MSGIRDICVFKCVVVPAFPIHRIVEGSECDVEIINIRTHNLARSPVRVPKTIGPAFEPFLFNQIPGQRGEIVRHVAFQAGCDGEHVAVFGDVTNALTGRTLYVGQERAAVSIWARGPPLVRGAYAANRGGTAAVIPAIPVTNPSIGECAVPRWTRSVLKSKPKSHGGCRETLYL